MKVTACLLTMNSKLVIVETLTVSNPANGEDLAKVARAGKRCG